MRFLNAVLLELAVTGSAIAVAPPQGPPPSIVPSPPPTTSVGPTGPPTSPPPSTPEPATLTIALVSAAAAGSFRLLRRKR